MRKKKLYHQFACSSLILPEHRARLARHHQKKAREACRGETSLTAADEQQQEQFQRLAEQSLARQLPLKVTVREGGSCRTITGVIIEQQSLSGKIRLQSGERVITIAVTTIIYLEPAF
jgi:hypothetical protein